MADEETFTQEQWSEKTNSGEWFNGLSEDVAKDPTMAKFVGKSPGDMAQSYIHLQKGYGDRVPAPRTTFTKEEWGQWNKEHNEGYPEDKAGYQINAPEGAPENFPYKEEHVEAFRNAAHEAGLTQSQAKHLWDRSVENNLGDYNEQVSNYDEMKKNDVASLKKEWGAAAPEKMKLARQVIQQFFEPDFVKEMGNQYVSAGVWRALAKIGSAFSEGKLEEFSTGSPSGFTPKEALSKANAFMEKHKTAYQDNQHPRHKEIVEKVRQMFKQAYPE